MRIHEFHFWTELLKSSFWPYSLFFLTAPVEKCLNSSAQYSKISRNEGWTMLRQREQKNVILLHLLSVNSTVYNTIFHSLKCLHITLFIFVAFPWNRLIPAHLQSHLVGVWTFLTRLSTFRNYCQNIWPIVFCSWESQKQFSANSPEPSDWQCSPSSPPHTHKTTTTIAKGSIVGASCSDRKYLSGFAHQGRDL